MFNKYFMETQVGDKWSSRGRTITESDIVMFASLSGDWYPLHVDKEYAAKTVFKQRIAHGMLSLSAATGLLDLSPGKVVAFYGMDKVRFIAPVFIGDTIHLEMEVVEKEEKGQDKGLVTAKMLIKNQRDETVLAAFLKMLLEKEE